MNHSVVPWCPLPQFNIKIHMFVYLPDIVLNVIPNIVIDTYLWPLYTTGLSFEMQPFFPFAAEDHLTAFVQNLISLPS